MASCLKKLLIGICLALVGAVLFHHLVDWGVMAPHTLTFGATGLLGWGLMDSKQTFPEFISSFWAQLAGFFLGEMVGGHLQKSDWNAGRSAGFVETWMPLQYLCCQLGLHYGKQVHAKMSGSVHEPIQHPSIPELAVKSGVWVGAKWLKLDGSFSMFNGWLHPIKGSMMTFGKVYNTLKAEIMGKSPKKKKSNKDNKTVKPAGRALDGESIPDAPVATGSSSTSRSVDSKSGGTSLGMKVFIAGLVFVLLFGGAIVLWLCLPAQKEEDNDIENPKRRSRRNSKNSDRESRSRSKSRSRRSKHSRSRSKSKSSRSRSRSKDSRRSSRSRSSKK